MAYLAKLHAKDKTRKMEIKYTHIRHFPYAQAKLVHTKVLVSKITMKLVELTYKLNFHIGGN